MPRFRSVSTLLALCVFEFAVGGSCALAEVPPTLRSPEYVNTEVAAGGACTVWSANVLKENATVYEPGDTFGFDQIFGPMEAGAPSCMKDIVRRMADDFACLPYQPNPNGSAAAGSQQINVNDDEAQRCFKYFGFQPTAGETYWNTPSRAFDDVILQKFFMGLSYPIDVVPRSFINPAYHDLWYGNPSFYETHKQDQTSNLLYELAYSKYYKAGCTPAEWPTCAVPCPSLYPGIDEKCWADSWRHKEAQDIGSRFGPPQSFVCHHYLEPNGTAYNLAGHLYGTCVDLTFYFRQGQNGCSIVRSDDPDVQRCSHQVAVDVAIHPTTPISLVWEADATVEEYGTFVRFPLNQGRGEEWFVWRGSPRTPMLVYDPEHRGKIDSATQLFGNWTFGGKHQARLDTPRRDVGAGDLVDGAWRDGFEALRTLDRNGDEVLTGAELEPLGVWFDEGADAKSSAGEVKPLAKLGITKLALGPTRTDSVSGNVYVDAGFYRMKDGVEERGAMVDWYAIGAATLTDLVAKQRLVAYQDFEGERPATLDAAVAAAFASRRSEDVERPMEIGGASQTSRKRTSISSPLNGVWSWRAAADPGQSRRGDPEGSSRGTLVLSERSDGSVGGMALTELPLKGNSVASMVHAIYVEGRVERRTATTIAFSLKSLSPGKGGKVGESLTNSTVELALGTNTMRGETTERLARDRAGAARSQNLKYVWAATKR